MADEKYDAYASRRLPDDVVQQTVAEWRKVKVTTEVARRLNLKRTTIVNRLAVAAVRGMLAPEELPQEAIAVMRNKIRGGAGTQFKPLLARITEMAQQGGPLPQYDLTHPLPPGLALQGTSIRYDGDGEVQQYWNKSKLEGRDPADTVQLPDPKTIVKVSTLYDQQGRVAQQWVAEKPEDIARKEAWQAFAKELAADLPKIDPISAPEHAAEHLMACYPVGDHHLGMLSWGAETGADYDLRIGERLLVGAVDHLIAAAPPCERAAVVFLGDFLHYDSFESVTPTSRNQLDSDSRYPKMVRTAIRAMRHTVESAAMRHKQVNVIVEIGNHDLSSSIFLMECLANIYADDPRITVDVSPAHYHYFSFGSVLVGTHHGHGVKMDQLPIIMATDRPDDWGRTKHRYWWTGHVHHSRTKMIADRGQDFVGCSVESFRILAPADAWAAQKGYRPIRDMTAIVLHKQHGEVARFKVNPDMLTTPEGE